MFKITFLIRIKYYNIRFIIATFHSMFPDSKSTAWCKCLEITSIQQSRMARWSTLFHFLVDSFSRASKQVRWVVLHTTGVMFMSPGWHPWPPHPPQESLRVISVTPEEYSLNNWIMKRSIFFLILLHSYISIYVIRKFLLVKKRWNSIYRTPGIWEMRIGLVEDW